MTQDKGQVPEALSYERDFAIMKDDATYLVQTAALAARGFNAQGLRGRGYYWRVNCDGMLECGDTYANFDRWALCNIDEVPMPKTRDEFREAVKTLLARKQGGAT